MTASALAASLQRIGQVQAHLSGPWSVSLAILAIGAAFLRWLWPVTQHITTMAHEGAHATMGSAVGRQVKGITFQANGFGATNVPGKDFLGTLSTGIAGYLGPSAFGVVAAEMIKAGYIVAVLWIGLAGLLAIMTVLRRSFGIISVAVAFVLLFAVAGFGSVRVQVLTAYGLAWFLLISGVQMIRIDGKGADDAKKLQGLTRIPGRFWSGFWLAGSVIALVFGGIQLL
ncbi:MAG TPA: M50 family metallopeptidase [Streptosporangiaceae bacterium]|nr:M50 family metallopeptidase [Streptosporangiaceae bacterium]